MERFQVPSLEHLIQGGWTMDYLPVSFSHIFWSTQCQTGCCCCYWMDIPLGSCKSCSKTGCDSFVLAFTHNTNTSCFGPLKKYWAQLCHEYMFANPGQVIAKYQFSDLFSLAWSKRMTISNITSGFQNSGIYLFNLQVILSKVSS